MTAGSHHVIYYSVNSWQLGEGFQQNLEDLQNKTHVFTDYHVLRHITRHNDSVASYLQEGLLEALYNGRTA